MIQTLKKNDREALYYFSLKFEGSLSQNLETIMDTKENDLEPQSDKDVSESKQDSNIIQFEKYKK